MSGDGGALCDTNEFDPFGADFVDDNIEGA
jgi:hypothetical protein